MINTLFIIIYDSTKAKWTATWQNQRSGMCAQRRLRSAWASAQSDQRLRCLHEETHWAHTEGTDQTGWMPRLTWVFARRTGHFVGFIMLQLKCQQSVFELVFRLYFYFYCWSDLRSAFTIPVTRAINWEQILLKMVNTLNTDVTADQGICYSSFAQGRIHWIMLND